MAFSGGMKPNLLPPPVASVASAPSPPPVTPAFKQSIFVVVAPVRFQQEAGVGGARDDPQRTIESMYHERVDICKAISGHWKSANKHCPHSNDTAR